jgi:hypothetical protein
MPRTVVLLLMGFVGLSPVRGQEPVVWVASPWQHVLRDSKPGGAASVEITAARHEYEPLRVIIRAGARALTKVRVEASALTGPNGRIEADNVILFREHYIHVFQPSPSSNAASGWYPDALIPLAGGNAAARFPASAERVESGVNQGFWVDVYVPRDTAPGDYAGKITALADNVPLGEVSVKVRVQPFTLPDSMAMRSNFGSLGSGLARRLGMDAGSPEFAAVEDQYIDTLLNHRAIPSSLGDIWPQWSPDKGIDDSRSGERLRMMVEKRHVNSLCVPFAHQSEPEKCRAYLHDMGTYLRGKGWLELAYIYMEDEPNDAEQYETVRRQGALIRESGIKRLCTEQTVASKSEWGSLYGAVDIWCPLWCLYDESTARERQQLGEEIWTYTALCQGNGKAPFWQIDLAPVHFRAPFWVNWHYGAKGFLYWSSIYWGKEQDPWTAPHFRERYWGEGMLLYPGKDAGVSGPVPSIRLKLIREAMEDFEYMTLAARQGRQSQVDEIVGSLVRSFSDWNQDPAAYAAAREKLVLCQILIFG